MKKPEIIILHETVLKSWLRDMSTLSLFVGLIGLGVLLDSTAMQWVGAIVGFLVLGSRASGREKRLDFDGARNRIDELEAQA